MKKIALFLTVFLTVGLFANAQDSKKPILSPRASVENDVLSVSYGQPSKRDRVIFGELVPYDKVWRVGANEATEITFKKPVQFGSVSIKPGTYTMFAIPGKTEWTIILNSELKQWGAYGYDKIKDKNIAEFKVPAGTINNVEEKLILAVNDNSLSIAWDKTMVRIPVTAK